MSSQAKTADSERRISRLAARARNGRRSLRCRQDAFDALATLGSPRSVAALRALVGDEKVDGWARRGAVDALGRSRRGRRQLLNVAGDFGVAPFVAERAVEVLDERDRVAALCSLASGEWVPPAARWRAVVALFARGLPGEAAAGVLELLRSGWSDLVESGSGIDLLERYGRVPHLAVLLRDQQIPDDAKLDAVRSLGRLGRSEELMSAIRDAGVDVDIRLRAVGLLGALGEPEALVAVAQVPLTGQQQAAGQVRKAVASALAELGSGFDHLLALAEDPTVDPPMREAAIVALADAPRGSEAIPALLALARQADGQPWVQRGAVAALASLGADSQLLGAAEDPRAHPWLRLGAVRTLMRVERGERRDEALRVLIGLTRLSEYDPALAYGIAELLGQLGQDGRLADLVTGPAVDARLRYAAASVLRGRLHGQLPSLLLATLDTGGLIDFPVQAVTALSLLSRGEPAALAGHRLCESASACDEHPHDALDFVVDPNGGPVQRMVAVEHLSNLAPCDAVIPLVAVASDPGVGPEVRERAAGVLLEIAGRTSGEEGRPPGDDSISGRPWAWDEPDWEGTELALESFDCPCCTGSA